MMLQNSSRSSSSVVAMAWTRAGSTTPSTTLRRLQHGAGERLLDRLEVQVLEDRTGLAVHEGLSVPLQKHTTVTKDTVGKTRGRLVEQNEIDRALGRGLEAGHEVADLPGRQPCSGDEPDGHIGVTAVVGTLPSARAEEKRLGHARVGFEDGAKPSDHGGSVAARLGRLAGQ
jgi:hypothetical protein